MDHIEMAFIDRDIDGLTHGATGMVDVRGEIGELYEVLEILDGAVASAVIHIADEWWSIDWCENHVVATDRDVAFGVSRMLYVCCWRCQQKRANKSFRKPHPITIDVGTSFTPHGLDFLVIFEIDTDFLQDRFGIGLDDLHSFLGAEFG